MSTPNTTSANSINSDPNPKPINLKKAAYVDFFMTIFLVFVLLGILYIVPRGTFSPLNLTILILILIPTIRALVSGAPFVPTPIVRVKKMLELANIKKGEKVIDIGCGDGRMVYLANKEYGADATGIELSPLVYVLARIRKLFWGSKAKIVFSDFHFYNLKEADVIMCYLLPEPLARLQSKLEKELKKGARVVSYAFKIGTWHETRSENRDLANNLAPIWIYER